VTRRRLWLLAGAVILVPAAVTAVMLIRSTMSVVAEADSAAIPTARVQRGSMDLTVYLDGDVRASSQQAIAAPTVGGSLRVLTLLETGAAVKAGDVILEFDPADQLHALEQAESELLEADQEIVRRRAEVEAQAAQDKVALLTAQFDVRRAELDAAVDADLIPGNEYKIRQASLEEAKRALAQAGQDMQARTTTSQAGLTVLQERRTKASLAAERARENITTLVVRAPMDGVMAVRENVDAAGGVFFSGMTLPPYRVGDTVNPGRPVLDIFDISRMEIRANVNEQERANVAPRQRALVESPAMPGVILPAEVTAVSGLGRAVRNAGPLRLFEVTLALEQVDPRLRPGTSVQVRVEGERVDDVLLVPRQAVFEHEGRPVVYERTAAGFEAREVKVLHRNESRVAVEGIAEGAGVALLAPDGAPEPAAPSAAGPGRGP
jgi:multidrug resistance efflux pump